MHQQKKGNHSTTTTASSNGIINNVRQQQSMQPQHVQQLHIPKQLHLQHHLQSQQAVQQQAQQVIQVSEEVFEQAAAAAANGGNMMISASGEIVNQPIFKILAADSSTGSVILDQVGHVATAASTSGGNVAGGITGNVSNNSPQQTHNSKMLLSNLTVLQSNKPTASSSVINANTAGQQQQPPTINFLGAKNISYLTAPSTLSLSSSAATITTLSATGKQQKYVMPPQTTYKMGNSKHMGQPQHHVVQKVTVARNLQVITTRVTTPAVISNSQQQALYSQQSTLRIPQQNYIASSVDGSSSHANSNNNGIISSGSKTISAGMSKKSGTLKMSPNKMLNSNIQQGVKAFIPQQQTKQTTQQPYYQINSKTKSKVVKHYNNAINSNNASVGGLAINALSQQQQVQPHMPLNIGQKPVTTRITKLAGTTNNTKFPNQSNQQIQNMSSLPHSTTQLQHGKTIALQNTISGSASINLQQSQPQHLVMGSSGGISNSNCSPSNIKFVNSHGTIIQHQAMPPTSSSMQSKVSTTTAYRPSQTQQQIRYVESSPNLSLDNINCNTSAVSGSNNMYNQPATSQTKSLISDDIVIVNGTQMTDEYSARILQSMAQKSYNNQHHRSTSHQQQHHVKSGTVSAATGSMPPPQQILIQQHTSGVSNTNANLNGSNVMLSPKYNTNVPVSPVKAVQYVQQPQHVSAYLPISAAATNVNVASSFVATSSVTSATSYYGQPPALVQAPLQNNLPTKSFSGVTSQITGVPKKAATSYSSTFERRILETSISRKQSEYFKNNNYNLTVGNHNPNQVSGGSRVNNATSAQNMAGIPDVQHQQLHLPIQSTQTLQRAQNIPLGVAALAGKPTTSPINRSVATSVGVTGPMKVLTTACSQNDDDLIGEEVRPVPVVTHDFRVHILHAVMQDHNYATSVTRILTNELISDSQHTAPTATTTTTTAASSQNAIAIGGVANIGNNIVPTSSVTSVQQWSMGPFGTTTAVMPVQSYNANAAPSTSSQLGTPLVNTTTSSNLSTYTIYGQQITRQPQDDDASSAISTGSRNALGEIDPGEETETAAEVDGEDESTRCICDLTHDDGYMICCDKCCAWQHVDCMGIDRQNIPDVYLCELCDPRPVDKAQARALQIMKRKEQSQLISSQMNAATIGDLTGSSNTGYMGVQSNMNIPPNDLAVVKHSLGSGSQYNYYNEPSGSNKIPSLVHNSVAHQGNTMPVIKKGRVLKKSKESIVSGGRRSKKNERLAVAASGASLNRSAGRGTRKETKKTTVRRKNKTVNDGSNPSGHSSGSSAADKIAANLRQWIENYELAVTNHYSPELRARIHSIIKQPSLMQSIQNTENKILKELGSSGFNLDKAATAVPQAGGKILVANWGIAANTPIFELRGKYMLTTQFKTQNASINMNSPPPSNYLLANSFKPHKTPGPFVFFYQLPGAESPTQTMNPDGTYPPLPPQPSYLKGPEICVDTRTYGNEARFVRRSCRPNAEIQHLFEKGSIHLFIVSLLDIRANTEITIRHEPHDMFAIENRKSTNCIVQPTSTPCACGLIKDCMFGPPMHFPLMGNLKSTTGRKSVTQASNSSFLDASAATMQLTMGMLPMVVNSNIGNKKKSLQTNRNRSTSSSGDSTFDLSSPNIPNSNCGTNNSNNIANFSNNAPNITKCVSVNSLSFPIIMTSGCTSNNLSISSSTMLSSVMHDSGICTSSSSPSVSIPSPTSNIHSPPTTLHQIKPNHQTHASLMLLPQPQQQQQQTNELSTMVTHNSLTPSASAITMDNAQQNETLTSLQHSNLHKSTIPDTLSPMKIVTNTVVTTTLPSPSALIQNVAEDQQKDEKSQNLVKHQEVNADTLLYKITAKREKKQSVSENTVDSMNELQLAAGALQSLNSMPQTVMTMPILSAPTLSETTKVSKELEQTPPVSPQKQNNDSLNAQHKLVNKISQHNPTTTKVTEKISSKPALSNAQRKAWGRKPRSASGSEENAKNQSSADESHPKPTKVMSSTPKEEKPKMSREDRKMEAILRAIEKMEKTEKLKQNKKATGTTSASKTRKSPTNQKRRSVANSSSELESSSGSAKRSALFGVRKSSTTRGKKKRKTYKTPTNTTAHHKRRQNKVGINSSTNASFADDGSSSEGETVHSGGATPRYSNDDSDNNVSATNVDQAADLLMAFANPNIGDQSSRPQTPQNNYTNEAADTVFKSPPPHQNNDSTGAAVKITPSTPPTPVSSACLLIEAAVGPLSHFDNVESTPTKSISENTITNADFKCPAKAKTKKMLLTNWYNEAEAVETSTNSSVPGIKIQSDIATEEINTETANNSFGLDSLVEAAMSDYKEQEEKEKKVKDENQQTEMQVYKEEQEDYEEQKEQLKIKLNSIKQDKIETETNLTPSVITMQDEEVFQQHEHNKDDLCQALPTISETILPTDGESSNKILPEKSVETIATTVASRSLHLPLQVSTCSNNSSVKKRWLRQAISEETDESFGTPSTASPTLPFVNTPSGAFAAQTNLQNGFTAPLKKRRLMVNSKNVAENATDLAASSTQEVNVTESFTAVKTLSNDTVLEAPLDLSAEECPVVTGVEMECDDVELDADVDVVGEPKCFIKEEGAEPDVGISNNCEKSLSVSKHISDVAIGCSTEEIKSEQEDDVDILRSPSPGQKMVAEDNLVKIEPEDTSGTDDVKIDVERVEVVLCDKFDEDSIDISTEEPVKKKHKIETKIKSPENSAISSLYPNIAASIAPSANSYAKITSTAHTIETIADSTCVKTPSPRPTNSTNLTEDDIKERLCSFHKENLLILQTRNRQSKSGTASPSMTPSITPVKKSLKKSHKKSNKHKSSKSSKVKSYSSSPHSKSKKKSKKDKKKKSDKRQHKEDDDLIKTPPLPLPASLASSSFSIVSSLASSSSLSSVDAITSSITPSSITSAEKNRQKLANCASKLFSLVSSSTANTISSSTVGPTISKKRQINFEDELTKDIHLAFGSGSISTSKHRSRDKEKEIVKDEAVDVRKKKQRDIVVSNTRDENRSTDNCNTNGKQAVSTSSKSYTPPFTFAPATVSSTFTTEVSNLSTMKNEPVETPHPIRFLREHPTIPHFNNVLTETTLNYLDKQVLPDTSQTSLHQSSGIFNSSISTPDFSVPPPNLMKPYDNSTGTISPPIQVPSTTTNMPNSESTLQELPSLVPPSNRLPFYNTVYGKLLENSQNLSYSMSASKTMTTSEPLSSSPTTPVTPVTPTTPATDYQSVSVTTESQTTISLSHYLDTKVKSFSTLGSYVPQSSLLTSGWNNYRTDSMAATGCSNNYSTSAPDTTNTIIGDKFLQPKKPILTKTASHDPRLNPSLTAPEPIPAPKRKLSIFEYRKRMQQSTKNDSSDNCEGSMSMNISSDIVCSSATTTTTVSSSTIAGQTTSSASNNSPSLIYNDYRTKFTLNSTDEFDSVDKLVENNLKRSRNKVEPAKGQFSAAPTLLEKQQEDYCKRMKLLKSQQSTSTAGSLSTVFTSDFDLKKESDDYLLSRNIISNIAGINAFDEITSSSSSSSSPSSRETSPVRCDFSGRARSENDKADDEVHCINTAEHVVSSTNQNGSDGDTELNNAASKDVN